MMPIIECMGLPGAGKTTVSTQLLGSEPGCVRMEDLYWEKVKNTGSRGILERLLSFLPVKIKLPISGPMSRMDVVHSFLSREAEYSNLVFSEITHFENHQHRSSFLYAWLKYVAECELVLKDKTDSRKILVEEGFAHRAMTLFGYSEQLPSVERIEAYVEKMPKPDQVLWVDTPPEICSHRLAKRLEPPLPLLTVPKKLWAGRLTVGREVLRTVFSELQKFDVQVIHITPETPSEEVKKQLFQKTETVDRLEANLVQKEGA